MITGAAGMVDRGTTRFTGRNGAERVSRTVHGVSLRARRGAEAYDSAKAGSPAAEREHPVRTG